MWRRRRDRSSRIKRSRGRPLKSRPLAIIIPTKLDIHRPATMQLSPPHIPRPLLLENPFSSRLSRRYHGTRSHYRRDPHRTHNPADHHRSRPDIFSKFSIEGSCLRRQNPIKHILARAKLVAPGDLRKLREVVLKNELALNRRVLTLHTRFKKQQF
jgi:hypothetical protein